MEIDPGFPHWMLIKFVDVSFLGVNKLKVVDK